MSKVTRPAKIAPIEQQNSPKYQEYLKVLDELFRSEGSEMLEAIGFICYISLDKPYGYPQPCGKIEVNLLAGRHIDCPSVQDLAEAERKLSESGGRLIWKTYLKGRRHDYYFYSRVDKIEDTLDLIEIAKVMVS